MDKTNIIQFNPFRSENNYLKLLNSNIGGLTIENATFTSCFFDGGLWKKLVFKNCHFNSCVFNSLDLSHCSFENCTFAYCNIKACKWILGSLHSMNWKKCQVVHNQWILCELDAATSQYVDEFAEQAEEAENTATWTLTRKVVNV